MPGTISFTTKQLRAQHSVQDMPVLVGSAKTIGRSYRVQQLQFLQNEVCFPEVTQRALDCADALHSKPPFNCNVHKV